MMDFVLANQWQDSFSIHNASPPKGSFLGLHLLLPQAAQPTRSRAGHPGPDLHGRPAVGASVRVQLKDGRVLISQIDGGSGHSGKRSPEALIGLGGVPASEMLDVAVQWRDPGGRVQNETLKFTPGWHTVVLGWPGTESTGSTR